MIKLVDLLLEDQKISTDHYQQILDKSNGLSSSNRQYFQSVINSIKKKNGIATPKQLNALQRLKTGNITYNSKLEERQIRIYDKVTDMVPGLEEYMSKLNFKPTTWRKQLVDILEKDTGYQNMVINLTDFTDSVKNELSTIEEFMDTIRDIMKEYEQIESEKMYLSPKDMDAVTELDDIYYKLHDAENQIEEYIDNLKKITESYETLEDTVRYTVKFDLNI